MRWGHGHHLVAKAAAPFEINHPPVARLAAAAEPPRNSRTSGYVGVP